jgi:cytochrome-b5 reductase
MSRLHGPLAPAYAYAYNPRGTRRVSSFPSSSKSSPASLLLKLAAAGLLIYGVLDFLDRQEKQLDAASVELNATTFVPFKVTGIDKVSPTMSIFHLQSPLPIPQDLLKPVASISISDPSLNIQRPYTVLSHDAGAGKISLLIKRYDEGDVSRFIHSKQVGSTLQIRAHPRAYELQDYAANGIKQLLCVVGGTGIAVAVQLAQALVAQQERMPRVAVLYASRSQEECVLQDQLDDLINRSKGKLSVHCVQDDKHGILTQRHIEEALNVKSSWFKGSSIDADTTQVLVCGSDGFVAHVAGVKPERGQGEVGGLLHQMHLNKHVWKL